MSTDDDPGGDRHEGNYEAAMQRSRARADRMEDFPDQEPEAEPAPESEPELSEFGGPIDEMCACGHPAWQHQFGCNVCGCIEFNPN